MRSNSSLCMCRDRWVLWIFKKKKNTKRFHLFSSFSVSKNQNDLILQKIDTSTFESTHNQSLCVCVYNALQPVLNFHLNEGKKKKYISFVLKTGFFLFRKRDSHVRRTQLMWCTINAFTVVCAFIRIYPKLISFEMKRISMAHLFIYQIITQFIIKDSFQL